MSANGPAVFQAMHAALCGPLDFSAFDAGAHDPALLDRARGVWRERLHSEFRSLQIVTRFLTELTASGEPVEMYAGAVDLIADEARHVGLCRDLCRAMGTSDALPTSPDLGDPAEFLAAPMVQRALGTAITMLLVNETISVAYLTDLAERCTDPVIGAVLRATVEDEEGHEAYGFEYVRHALRRFAPSTLPDWRALTRRALAPHHAWAESIEPEWRDEPALVALGLFSPQRQAAVFRTVWADVLGPRLATLQLL